MTQNQVDTLEQEIQSLSKKEVFAFRQFENVYKVEHPEPRRAFVNLGLEFWTALVTSISAIVLAAFRTGQAFYLASAAGGNTSLATWEAISAVFAIEGSVVLFAINRARRAQKLDDTSSEWGLWIAFIISALAGLFQSSHLLSEASMFSELLKWSLVIFMGLGASIIAFLGGDVLGVQLVRLEQSKLEETSRFTKAVQGWRANLLKAWKDSSELRAVHGRKGARYGNFPTPIETYPNFPESSQKVHKLSESSTDWRKFRPKLSEEMITFLATSELSEILQKLSEMGVELSERTASNWKVYARKERNLP